MLRYVIAVQRHGKTVRTIDAKSLMKKVDLTVQELRGHLQRISKQRAYKRDGVKFILV